MRGKCEFGTCRCACFVRCHAQYDRCVCGHGKVWHQPKHKTSVHQFLSLRASVRRPYYVSGMLCIPTVWAVPDEPTAPPLPEPYDPGRFCATVDELPL